jgi:hypothetical protein
MKPKIFISHMIPDEGINMLKDKFEIELNNTIGICTKDF